MDQPNHNILVWNVRGLNARCRRDAMRTMIGDANITVACLQETKLQDVSRFLACEMLGQRFTSFAQLPSTGASGGILVACRGPEVSCYTVHTGRSSPKDAVQLLAEITQEGWL
uniref:Endonuclease/exonuclease/phosphatase domain-containing protein n=1 Tax=Setaria viridis TaxID=4556 RepID=A0A4U6WGL4_SETVI|nr:hypothetical protein SEVIR_1G353700v2 [Setaria viridis]